MNWTLEYRLHSRLDSFRRQVEKSLALIQNWLSLCRKPYAAFSGGKDSAVMLHLVRRLAPDLLALYSDDEWQLPETTVYLDTIPNLHRIAAKIKHSDWFTSWEDNGAHRPGNAEWVEAKGNDGAGTWAKANGYDGVSVGIRADENSYRRVHIRSFGTLYHCQKADGWRVYPLADWSVKDVWAYLVSNEITYNAAYDKLRVIGVSPEHQRIGPFANRRALGYGQLAILKQGWPELYFQFAEEHPEARQYV